MPKITFIFALPSLLTLALAATTPVGVEAANKTVTKTVAKKSSKRGPDLYNPQRRYQDEKKDIVDATSRCNTPALQKVHAHNFARALKDGAPFELTPASVSTTEQLSGLEQAYKKYLDGLSFVWGAMEEPYCGFGAFGVKAARKSYDKSVERARARFLDAARQEENF